MSPIAVTERVGHDGTVEHPARWHRDQFPHRGPHWLRNRGGHGGPLRREPADRLGGGVGAGIAAWRGFSPTTVRIVFVLATLVSTGWGVPLYVLAWLFIPAAGAEANIFSKARNDAGGIRLAVGLASLLIFVLLVAGALNGGWFIGWAWPQVFSVAGLALIWRNAPEEDQATLRHLLEPLGVATGNVKPNRRSALRLVIAGALMAGGLGWLFSAHASLALLRPLGGVLLVNAAKWSGAGVISLFAEIEPGEVSIVVRDRGKGFDPGAVPEDRKGLAESVHGRMTRRGGTATVTTAPGEGTKVTLKMPRSSLPAGKT